MTSAPHPDLNTAAQRRRFVSLFVARVARDEVLGPAFVRARPDGRRHVSRQEYLWWDQALAGTCYYGPPPRGYRLPPLLTAYFTRWRRVLDDTFEQYFDGPQAREARGHVLNMATMLAHWRLAH